MRGGEPGTAPPAIETTDLRVRYGRLEALDGLTLRVARGEAFGFLGPNGAGKSTLIKTLIGILQPTSGVCRVHGASPLDARVRARVGYLPEEANFPAFLTPIEVLSFYAEVFGMSASERRRRIADLLTRLGLERVARCRVSTLSKGTLQKLNLAQALLNDPDTLILDEPSSGLDPLARLELRELLREQSRAGKTVFFSSHELSEVELVCDSIAILREGRLVRAGSTREILREAGGQSLERFFLNSIGAGETR